MFMTFDKDELKTIAAALTEEIKPMLSKLLKQDKASTCSPMNINELADYMKVSKNFIYKLIHDKKIPHIKRGNKLLLFNREEINKWLNSYKVPVLTESKNDKLDKKQFD